MNCWPADIQLLSRNFASYDNFVRNWLEQPLAGPEGTQTDTNRFVQMEKQIAGIEAELAQQLPEVRIDNLLKSAERRGVAEALPEGAVLVEFVRFSARDFGAAPRLAGSTRYAAFVLRASEPDQVRLIDLGEAESIDRLVSQFRESISYAPSWLSSLIGHVRPRSRSNTQERTAICPSGTSPSRGTLDIVIEGSNHVELADG